MLSIKNNIGGKSSGLYVWKKYENIPIITFKLGYTYQAVEGMTWSEWVASSYNTNGYAISSDGKVVNRTGRSYIVYEGVAVTPDDIIKPNYEYSFVGSSGGSN